MSEELIPENNQGSQMAEQIPEVVENTTADENKNVAPEEKIPRASRFKEVQNRLKELESERSNERKSYKELEERYKGLAPLERFKEQIVKALEAKELAEQQQQYANNPMELQRRMAQEEAKKLIEPMQSQFQEMQSQKQLNDTVNYLQETYGAELFNAARPAMGETLNHFEKTHGRDASDWLAAHPDELMIRVLGEHALGQYRDNQKQKQVGTANQSKAAQVMAGVSRPNTSNPRDANTVYNKKLSKQEVEDIIAEGLNKKFYK